MSRTLGAFLWLRWRLTANALAGGRGRDLMASFAAWATLLVRLILGLVLVGAILVVAVVAGVLASALARGGGLGPDAAVLGLRVVLGVLSLVLVLFPLITRSGGDLAAAQRLRLLPVRERHLDLLDIAGAFADPWLMAIVPVPLVMSAVLWWSGRLAWAAVALAGGVLMLGCLALASTVMRRLVGLVLRDRRRSEAAALGLIVGIMVLSTASVWIEPLMRPMVAEPHVVVVDQDGNVIERDGAVVAGPAPEPDTAVRADPEMSGELAEMMAAARAAKAVDGHSPKGPELRDLARGFPLVLQVLPSELFLRSLVACLEGDAAIVAGSLVALMVLAALLLFVARRLWRRTVGSPAISGRTSAGRRRLVGLERLPGLSPAATAVAWTQATTSLRTIAGKLALGMPTLAMLVMVVPLQTALAEEKSLVLNLFQGPQLALASVALALLGIQPFALNQFAADGEGLARQFLVPLSNRDLVVGKAAGLGLLVGLSAFLAVVATAALVARGAIGSWLALLLTVLPVYLLMAPVSVFLSLYFPKAMDLGGLGKKSKPHPLATILGLLALGAVMAPTVTLVAIGLGFMAAPWWTSLAVLLLALASAAAAIPGLNYAASLLVHRREAILAAIRDR